MQSAYCDHCNCYHFFNVINLSHKNAIKHEKGSPPRFSDNPKYPLKRIWPNSKDFQLLCIYG